MIQPVSSFQMPRRAHLDSRTGREVWQVTDGEFECVSAYMEDCCWSSDDRYLVIACNRTGKWQPYRLELATGIATQLAELDHLGFRACNLDPIRNELYCRDGNQVVAIHMETRERRVAADFSRFYPEPTGGCPSLNRDATVTVSPRKFGPGRGILIVAPTDGSNEFEVLEMPRDHMSPGHEQFCPADDNLISFCSAPDLQNDPTWEPFVRAREYRIDRRTREVRPLVLMPTGFRATHCVWGRSGQRIYFHRKTVPGWTPTALCSVDSEGGGLRVYFETREHKLGHCSPSPDETWLVTDSQDPGQNMLMLVHLDRDEQHLLCWPNSSIKTPRPHRRLPQLPPHTDTDVHPNFSGTGKFVAFNSDVSGRSQVYVVPVSDLTAR